MLVFVSPSNPTGSVYTAEETKAIGEWAVEHGIWIISDEIYQNLTYEGVKATSIVEAVPAAANQTILVNGVAKTYAMTGWRVGWMVGPADAIKIAGNLQSHHQQREQRGAEGGDRGAQRPADRGRAVPRGVRPASSPHRVGAVEDRRPRGAQPARRVLRVPRCAGPARSHVGRGDPTTSLELADLILDQAEVAVVPGEAFGPSGYIRMSYALGDEQLLEGVQRLQRLFS